jgi:UDP-3-O-[3-hydroxymyristoyl] glucosamine N-acyltransferase
VIREDEKPWQSVHLATTAGIGAGVAVGLGVAVGAGVAVEFGVAVGAGVGVAVAALTTAKALERVTLVLLSLTEQL